MMRNRGLGHAAFGPACAQTGMRTPSDDVGSGSLIEPTGPDWRVQRIKLVRLHGDAPVAGAIHVKLREVR